MLLFVRPYHTFHTLLIYVPCIVLQVCSTIQVNRLVIRGALKKISQKVEKVQKGGGRAGNFCGTQEPTETIYSFAVSF